MHTPIRFVVAPIDPAAAEAPYACKDITPVVQTTEDAAIARRVARMWPLRTVKG